MSQNLQKGVALRTPRRRRWARILLIVVLVLLGLCALGAIASALSNRTLPPPPEVLDRLTPADKAGLREAIHLKAALGDSVWPGWGAADIPVILWNSEYEFLVGLEQAPGWDPVPEDTFEGRPYLRRPADDPQNFSVPVADTYAGSLATHYEMDAFLREMFGEMLPGPLKAVVPWRLILQATEVHISGVLHETFHAYQAMVAPERLEAAERAYRLGERYWPADVEMREAWGTEIDLLARALGAKTEDEAADLARQFLEARAARRGALASDLVDYERHLEWEEGLAKYVELSIWRAAYEAPEYTPALAPGEDAQFSAYRGYPQRWSQEVGQMRRQAGREGETRFYYTGMAQAVLLDRLLPGWQARALHEGVWLEDLLSGATATDATEARAFGDDVRLGLSSGYVR